MKKIGFFLLLLGYQSLLAQSPSFIKDSLDGYINQGIKEWSIPGLSIVIVKDGKVVMMNRILVAACRNAECPSIVSEFIRFHFNAVGAFHVNSSSVVIEIVVHDLCI